MTCSLYALDEENKKAAEKTSERFLSVLILANLLHHLGVAGLFFSEAAVVALIIVLIAKMLTT